MNDQSTDFHKVKATVAAIDALTESERRLVLHAYCDNCYAKSEQCQCPPLPEEVTVDYTKGGKFFPLL